MNNFFRIFTFTVVLSIQSIFAQTSPQNLWQEVDESQIVQVGERYIIPQVYRTIKLNVEEMQSFLSGAPLEFSNATRSTVFILDLPMPNGTMQKFSIVESPIMAPELAAKYPEIRTYLGKGIDDPLANVRFDFTLHGFHAMILSPEGNVFIDPYSLGDVQNYISYYTKDFTKIGTTFECEVFSDESRLNELNYLRESMILDVYKRQALLPHQFEEMMQQIRLIASVIGRTM